MCPQPLYMCPHIPIYVSSYLYICVIIPYICVLKPLCMCPQTSIYVGLQAEERLLVTVTRFNARVTTCFTACLTDSSLLPLIALLLALLPALLPALLTAPTHSRSSDWDCKRKRHHQLLEHKNTYYSRSRHPPRSKRMPASELRRYRATNASKRRSGARSQ